MTCFLFNLPGGDPRLRAPPPRAPPEVHPLDRGRRPPLLPAGRRPWRVAPPHGPRVRLRAGTYVPFEHSKSCLHRSEHNDLVNIQLS